MYYCKMKYLDFHTHKNGKANSILNINYKSELEIPKCLYSIGIHPWSIPDRVDWSVFEMLVKQPNCVAIGECGLDKLQSNKSLSIQEELFKRQLLIAEEVQKPVIIHCVRAHQEVLRLKEKLSPDTSWVMHGFNKGKRIAFPLMEKGILFSFGSNVLKNRSIQELLLTYKEIQFFLETDDQDEVSIEQIYSFVAELVEIDLQELKSKIMDFAKQIGILL